jgi:hypothetical protein
VSLTPASYGDGTGPDFWGEVWPNRWALKEEFWLFSDQGDGNPAWAEGDEGLVGSVQFRDDVMTAEQIKALGGATAAGIGAVPEPATMIALGAGVSALLIRRKRR